jgi:hypothetical protein
VAVTRVRAARTVLIEPRLLRVFMPMRHPPA